MVPEETVNTEQDLRRVLARIRFKNTVLDFKWAFGWTEFHGIFLLHVTFERPDAETGVVGRGQGREELIRPGATVSSVVKTAWLLVKLMVGHELAEGFQYKDERIFNPHHTVEELGSIRRKPRFVGVCGGCGMTRRCSDPELWEQPTVASCLGCFELIPMKQETP